MSLVDGWKLQFHKTLNTTDEKELYKLIGKQDVRTTGYMPLPGHKTQVNIKDKMVRSAFYQELKIPQSEDNNDNSALRSMNYKVTMNWALHNGSETFLFGDYNLN